jgi:para-aminobenzoate synthetase/4-amino-4-deoxychorismate lyase
MTATAVRFARVPLGLVPTLSEVVAAIDGLALPFVLAGRWGLPDGADASSRVLVAGAEPTAVAPRDAGGDTDRSRDPFAVLGDLPSVEGDLPDGVIGGGWIGWLGYGLGRDVERTLGPQPSRPIPLSAVRMAWYDDVLRRDEDDVWWVEALLPAGDRSDGALTAASERWHARFAAAATEDRRAPAARLGTMRPHGGAAAHRAAVAETVERIHAGELFQANVCLRLEGPLESADGREDAPRAAGLAAPVLASTDPWFGAWIGGHDGQAIVSSSPELFLRRRGREVATGPIKGTAPRRTGSLDPATDTAAAALLASAKDRAEHVMIVDLMRNDLGRVCDYGSVRYEATPRLEPHAGVWHLVSDVGGRLHEGLGDPSLLRATFPPGSVTGAPKVQAQRVIAAVEGTGREIYTGAHGFLSPVAGLELAVTIRTIEIDGERAWIGVGGGVVADSSPQGELDEALGKAAALVAAAGGTIDAATALSGPEDGPGRVPVPGTAPPWIRSADRRPDPRGGLLETLLVRDGAPPARIDAHLARLTRSIKALGLPPLERPVGRLAADLVALAATAPAGAARLRVLARPAAATTRVELQLVPFTFDPATPIDLAPVVVPGGIGPHKWLDRDLIDALTARLGASPLLLDADGTALETGWATLWWISGDALHTPPADGRILPGVTRAAVLDAAGAAPLVIRETNAHVDALADVPLLLTSARGFSVGRLPTTSAASLHRATQLAARLAPLLGG